MKWLSYLAWTTSLAATLGSIFMSKVLNFVPCELCWYQRIFMFPLVLVIAVGILKKDKNLPQYVLPLSTAGLLIGAYHNLLYYGVIAENISPCRIDVPCTARQLELFGFIAIPLLSLVSFVIITFCMILLWRAKKK